MDYREIKLDSFKFKEHIETKELSVGDREWLENFKLTFNTERYWTIKTDIRYGHYLAYHKLFQRKLKLIKLKNITKNNLTFIIAFYAEEIRRKILTPDYEVTVFCRNKKEGLDADFVITADDIDKVINSLQDLKRRYK
jgi:hypothetical protein